MWNNTDVECRVSSGGVGTVTEGLDAGGTAGAVLGDLPGTTEFKEKAIADL